MFVPFTRPLIPWARRPIPFPNNITTASRYFGFLQRRRYSGYSLVSPLMTAPSHSHNISNGNVSMLVSLVLHFFVVSIHATITSCVNVIVLRLLSHVLFAGGLLSYWVM